jgi:hypothetical protein
MDRKALHHDAIRRARDGESGRRIARETGVPITTVNTWINDPGREVRAPRRGTRRERAAPHFLRAEVLRLFDRGLTGYQIGRLTGVPDSTVYYWRDHPDKPVRGTVRCFRCAPRTARPDRPAYAYLLGQYLGDGHIVAGPGSAVLPISCCDAWPGIMEETERAMRAALPGVSVHRARKTGCTSVSGASRHWPCLFPQHGPGRKHERAIVLESWQRSIVDAHPKAFVRGLIHSDGCRSINRIRDRSGNGYHEYARYFFSNKSMDIHGLLIEALDRLGIAWRFSKPDVISVARRDAVARLDGFVGAKY